MRELRAAVDVTSPPEPELSPHALPQGPHRNRTDAQTVPDHGGPRQSCFSPPHPQAMRRCRVCQHGALGCAVDVRSSLTVAGTRLATRRTITLCVHGSRSFDLWAALSTACCLLQASPLFTQTPTDRDSPPQEAFWNCADVAIKAAGYSGPTGCSVPGPQPRTGAGVIYYPGNEPVCGACLCNQWSASLVIEGAPTQHTRWVCCCC
jgi:hypothetical protein